MTASACCAESSTKAADKPSSMPVELVVNSLVRDLGGVAALSVRRIDRRLHPQHHAVQQFDDRGKQQRALVLSLCRSFEQFVEPFGLEKILQHRLRHDANRAPLDKRLKNTG